MQKSGVVSAETLLARQQKALQEKQAYEQRVGRRVSEATANGVRFTFSVKPRDGELPIANTLRRVFK